MTTQLINVTQTWTAVPGSGKNISIDPRCKMLKAYIGELAPTTEDVFVSFNDPRVFVLSGSTEKLFLKSDLKDAQAVINEVA